MLRSVNARGGALLGRAAVAARAWTCSSRHLSCNMGGGPECTGGLFCARHCTHSWTMLSRAVRCILVLFECARVHSVRYEVRP